MVPLGWNRLAGVHLQTAVPASRTPVTVAPAEISHIAPLVLAFNYCQQFEATILT
jgi:hypothetical protein